MKHREERQKVMVRARMRSGVSWHDVCVLNLSPHGVGIQAAEPPERGSYVEIRRGKQTIVARVVWAKGHRAGLRSQDVIFIPAFIAELGRPEAQVPAIASSGCFVERRQSPRPPRQRFENSRLLARAAQFACLVLFGGAAAYTAFGAVEQALAQPLSQIGNALDAQ